MGYPDGKADDFFDQEFDFDKDGILDELERYLQFDIINKLQHDTGEDTMENRYVEDDRTGNDDEGKDDRNGASYQSFTGSALFVL